MTTPNIKPLDSFKETRDLLYNQGQGLMNTDISTKKRTIKIIDLSGSAHGTFDNPLRSNILTLEMDATDAEATTRFDTSKIVFHTHISCKDGTPLEGCSPSANLVASMIDTMDMSINGVKVVKYDSGEFLHHHLMESINTVSADQEESVPSMLNPVFSENYSYERAPAPKYDPDALLKPDGTTTGSKIGPDGVSIVKCLDDKPMSVSGKRKERNDNWVSAYNKPVPVPFSFKEAFHLEGIYTFIDKIKITIKLKVDKDGNSFEGFETLNTGVAESAKRPKACISMITLELDQYCQDASELALAIDRKKEGTQEVISFVGHHHQIMEIKNTGNWAYPVVAQSDVQAVTIYQRAKNCVSGVAGAVKYTGECQLWLGNSMNNKEDTSVIEHADHEYSVNMATPLDKLQINYGGIIYPADPISTTIIAPAFTSLGVGGGVVYESGPIWEPVPLYNEYLKSINLSPHDGLRPFVSFQDFKKTFNFARICPWSTSNGLHTHPSADLLTIKGFAGPLTSLKYDLVISKLHYIYIGANRVVTTSGY